VRSLCVVCPLLATAMKKIFERTET
jgi:hypothetical protein